VADSYEGTGIYEPTTNQQLIGQFQSFCQKMILPTRLRECDMGLMLTTPKILGSNSAVVHRGL
jgi:hypothetical protein